MTKRREVREWVESQDIWPTADSYELSTLTPRPQLQHREESLRPLVPDWFWNGEEDASILSIGTGKGYFERRYWQNFDQVFVVDPMENTRLLLEYFPIDNVTFLSRSLFSLSWRHQPYRVPKYGWLGASIHYVFREFYGWRFMQHLAMLVSDTLVIDAGVFDATSRQGMNLREQWKSRKTVGEPFDVFMVYSFSYDSFLESISGLWRIEMETPTPWIDDGRRNLILKRELPPPIQLSDLGDLLPIDKRGDLPKDVFRTEFGYLKMDSRMSKILIYDTYSKCILGGNMVTYTVYEDDRYIGFLVRDFGDSLPDTLNYQVSEQLYLSLLEWLLPLGLVPLDVARDNMRIDSGETVWIDVDIGGLSDLNPLAALWMMSNIYKGYSRIPQYILRPDGRSSMMKQWTAYRRGLLPPAKTPGTKEVTEPRS